MSKNKKEELHKTNEEIEKVTNQVFLVGEDFKDTYSTKEALDIADEKELDLVMVGEKADPPVCKLMDYNKYLFDKKKKESKNNNKKPKQKEIRFTPHTAENDFNFKKNHVLKFLEKGHDVRAYVMFKGRELNNFSEEGEKLLLNLAVAVEDVGVVDKKPQLNGKNMEMTIKPKSNKNG